MNALLILFLIFVVIYSCVSWLLPTLLAWLFMRKYHIKLKIGRIAVPKLILKDVSLSKDRYSIHIDEISFQSSCFNSDINKLVSVVIRGVEVTNNVEEKKNVVVETILKPLLSKQNSAARSDGYEEMADVNNLESNLNRIANKKLLDFRDKKLPPSLIMFAQFMSVHIFNASATIHSGTVDNPWTLTLTAAEVHADGAAGGPARALVFSTKLVEAKAKVVGKGECLGEAMCCLVIEGTVKADGPLNVEKIHVIISNTSVTFKDELYQFLKSQKKRRRTRVLQVNDEDHLATIIPRFSPVIPKIFSLKIDSTRISCKDKTVNTNFEMSLQSLQVNSRFSAASVHYDESGVEVSGLPQVYVAFQMEQYQLVADGLPLAVLNKLKLDAKLEKGVLNLYIIISTLNISYSHTDAFKWYKSVKDKIRKAQPLQIMEVESPSPSPPIWLSRIFSSCIVQGCAELRAVSVHARLTNHNALGFGCSGVKVKLDQLLETREEWYRCSVARQAVGGNQWGAELLVDGGWMACGPAALTVRSPPPRRHHTWGEALLAVALVKWATHGPNDSKVEAMVDCLRLEWSPIIAQTIISLADCLNEYKSSSPMVQDLEEVSETSSNISVNVALSHINLFLIVNEDMCLMTRVDAVTLEKNVSKSGAVISGLKVVDIVPYKGNIHCQRSDEIPSTFFHVKLARIEYLLSKEKYSSLLDVQFIENVDLEWSANLHLKVVTFVRAVKEFQQELRVRRSQVVKKKGRALDWRVAFKGETNLGLILSKENSMLFATDDMTIAYDHEIGLSIVWSKLNMILNGDEVIMVEGYSQERVADDLEVRVERKANEGFALTWNKVWLVTVDSVRVVFPYKHRFAEAVQGDFVSLFKWIKLVHGIKKKPFTVDSPLPSDLHIKIEELLIEMSDDPFEVKLRDNYELLEDEYKESQKRRTMLDAKVQELCKPHLFLPAGKVEELYSALRQKDAQIYVQRCRAAPPPRTRLVACCLSRFSLVALADPTIHGTQNAQARLREIDHDSPWPEDGIEFTTLWCRSINMSCSQWQLLLRDFPQPLLSMSELKMWGTLLAAEEQAPPRAVRTVTIDQGAPWGEQELERSMMPLKWYYDLCCEMAEYSYAFGPCWEPVIAHCNLSFDQVSRPSLDPSAPLSWWDKVRLLMHGRLTVNCAKFTCLLHVSLDPYNTTEEMEVTWTDLVLDWTNGRLGFLGTLDVYVRTASKYDDCRVLRVPALRLSVKLGWQCVADPRDHHAVAPCAPTRLPEYSSNQEHDSYRAFRSQGLDLHLSMETKPVDKEGNGPVLLLYGSTLRWFESLKLILSGITRPTRRGRIFKNVRPRKPQLSRHYRNVSVSVTLHNLQVFYWSSSSLQRGIEMLGVRVTCGSKHRLSLVATNDGLVRRPRANWTTVYMNCDLNDAEIWLKTLAADEKDGDEYPGLAARVLEKCYCLSVRRVSYGREAGACTAACTGAPPTHRLAVHDLRGAWTKLNRDLAFALIDTYIKTQQLKKNLSTKALKEEEQPNTSPKHQREADVISPPPPVNTQSSGAAAGCGGGMLAALVAEAGGAAPVVFSDELSGAEADAPPPIATHLRHELDDDNAHTACLIELVNSQVVLKGCETRGYVILCAAFILEGSVRQRVRRAPAAAAWSGALSAMQYYATVSAADRDQLLENIQWVSVEEIEERWQSAEISTLPDVPRLVGSGHSAGGVIGRTVGPSADTGLAQLQRIVSRCACEFYYVSHEEAESAGQGAGWAQQQPYDSFTLMHHDLNVCTNSLQVSSCQMSRSLVFYSCIKCIVYFIQNSTYWNVLVPQEPSGRAPLARRAALRVFCRDRPPVGGIAVKEHFEVNIVPIKIGLTKKFFNTMLKFCFPERDPDSIEDGEEETEGTLKAGASSSSLVSTGSKKIKKKSKDSNSNFYVKRDKKDKDDVEKMKERAEKNKLFIYIKIPEVPVRVSYKGSKEKNLEDVRDLPLVLPTLEYHNVTWTWLDLLLATKSDTRRVILSQAIRQKLQLHRRAAAAPEPHEEDKARLLLGERTVAENKPQKKGTPSVFKFSKS
ncbi:protein KIAA0100 [Spodoptera litura]|uniref:Protein KIAA0100 n=1 Tax=Spodoptera litura TaxID=69820 RepID=A0A9J7E062_SPOLT|nr:protein KIAA0100 [Spodoptera litura]